MREFQIINPINHPGWDHLILSTRDYSFFHSSAWAKVLAESYGYTPLYFTVLESGKVQALIPITEVNSFLTGKRGISLPFTDYCDPIINEDISFSNLFSHIIEFGKNRGWKYIELRGGDKYLMSEDSGVRYQDSALNPSGSRPTPNTLHPTPRPSSTYFSHTLDLTEGEKRTFSNLRDSTKRNIKKAVKEGVKVEISQSLESVKEFYRLNCITRKDHGLPPQPYSFFNKVYEHILTNNFGFVVLASFEAKAIAGAVYFNFEEKAVYKYGASDKGFQHLRANNLLMWEGIRECTRRRCTILSLGRTDLDHEGLLQFKRGWGTREETIKYFRYDFRKKTFVRDHSKVWRFSQFFKRTPSPLLNHIGTILYRHIA